MTINHISKYISLILRHKPETIGIALDEHGWANVGELIEGVNKKYPFTMEMLEEIVKTDPKNRYSFNDDKTLIRANQGHSIPVDVELEQVEPPAILYHGTGEKFVAAIDEIGLIPKSRLYVHLSSDIDTAIKVGKRHGKPVVYEIDCKAMAVDNYKFYISVNGVWLTKRVPSQYIKKLWYVIKNDSKKRIELTPEQEAAWMDFIKNDVTYCKYYDEFVVLLGTGMRVSEFCGLTKKDINFELRRIRVDHQLVRERSGKYYVEKTKTESGCRFIPMTEEVYTSLKNIVKNRRKVKNEMIVDGYG